jgi:hypothetical protein
MIFKSRRTRRRPLSPAGTLLTRRFSCFRRPGSGRARPREAAPGSAGSRSERRLAPPPRRSSRVIRSGTPFGEPALHANGAGWKRSGGSGPARAARLGPARDGPGRPARTAQLGTRSQDRNGSGGRLGQHDLALAARPGRRGRRGRRGMGSFGRFRLGLAGLARRGTARAAGSDGPAWLSQPARAARLKTARAGRLGLLGAARRGRRDPRRLGLDGLGRTAR